MAEHTYTSSQQPQFSKAYTHIRTPMCVQWLELLYCSKVVRLLYRYVEYSNSISEESRLLEVPTSK